MWRPMIGDNAGIIWKILSGKGEVPLGTLKKTTKLDERHLFLALGWLAREGKVEFTGNEHEIGVILTEGKI